MADVIDYQIHGDDMQLVEVELDPGEGVRAEAGAMMMIEDDIVMQLSIMISNLSAVLKTPCLAGKGSF
jgi:uncharacterized protein (AIM24 family)